MNKAFVKKYGTLLLLATGAGIIFQLPYIRETFYVPIQNAMNLSNAQMGLLSSGYATMSLFSYFIGGIIADKFSARKLLTFSFIATGILGLWFSTFPGYTISRVIFVLMGISTIITYWSACIKATRMLGTDEEQGRLFGLQEGLRGIMNALLVFGMTAAFTRFADEVAGASAAIKVCSIVVIIIGILNFIFIEDTKKEENSESLAEITKGMFKALLIPRVWLLVAIVFTAYSVYGLIAYATTFAQQFYGLSAASAATLGGVRYLIQGAGGIVGGFLADKMKSRFKVIIGGCIGLALSFGLFIVMPSKASLCVMVVANFFVGLFFIYAVRSQYFAVHDDAGIPINMSGRVSGIASCLGYTPDIFMYTLVGSWMDNYGRTGYNMTWAYAMIAAVLCAIITFILSRIVKKENAQKTA
ncbi:MFS transporter [[Clostridium] hylemonae]|uniref:Transporter, major facilitator family protein n=1 Tax=[Clostridium] hylemonae DSM 15053 TaxID=553973 RepID=C0C4A7_9FIRM|nr:MFS transporter [[Clostridium] hylemonae]EEG72900.1 transporter, major facilitator family protein [[Clostridium] hylemonae DSM 15053]MCB7523132.1 MFS transporter [[Clostridium] hylemonae]QEK16344.1 Inner membrane protein YqcE [[Clostridium] hylemonae DSM 15053]BDF03859.1 MFS transporter [[Clostridium] hylemonae]